MLFLRVYPYLIRFFYFLGKRSGRRHVYVFLQVSRTDGREQFLMLFMVLALSVGIFNANAARTINQNSEMKSRIGRCGSRDTEQWVEYNADGSAASAYVPTMAGTATKDTHFEEPRLSALPR
jgi:putative ABC transport system permease protein